jgi:hypothetical protein
MSIAGAFLYRYLLDLKGLCKFRGDSLVAYAGVRLVWSHSGIQRVLLRDLCILPCDCSSETFGKLVHSTE